MNLSLFFYYYEKSIGVLPMGKKSAVHSVLLPMRIRHSLNQVQTYKYFDKLKRTTITPQPFLLH